jgi:hypothetical protein
MGYYPPKDDHGISFAVEAIQTSIQQAADTIREKLTAPHVIYKAVLKARGSYWVAVLPGDSNAGEEEGLWGVGETPEKAMDSFDLTWRNQRTPRAIEKQLETIKKEEADEEARNNGPFGVGA